MCKYCASTSQLEIQDARLSGLEKAAGYFLAAVSFGLLAIVLAVAITS